jgi:glycosyltransferase involved in cell wall biosynthesis
MNAGAGPALTPQSERVLDVSVLVPVLNEERHIRATVAAMRAQLFDGSIELLFADGRSDDRTRAILEELAARDPRIRVLDNPRRHTASGLNVGLREARGEFVARMDAHTYYSPRYLAAGVERLRRGGTEWVSGPAVPRPGGLVSHAVALALASRLGRGGSRKWSEEADRDEERELDTGVFGGVWRRETLLAAGGWDERWPINQDSEMAARFLERGARLVCVAEMAAHYVPRDSLAALARQYFYYGFYRARTFRRHPRSMRTSHLIAPALVVVLAGAIAGPRRVRPLARLGAAAYVVALAGTAASTAARGGDRRHAALLVAVLPTMHLGWGVGTLAGMVRFGPPLAALAHAAGARTSAGPPADAAAGSPNGVYAPSLRRAD